MTNLSKEKRKAVTWSKCPECNGPTVKHITKTNKVEVSFIKCESLVCSWQTPASYSAFKK